MERAEVTDGLLRVHHNPAIQDKMQKLHNGHQDHSLTVVCDIVLENLRPDSDVIFFSFFAIDSSESSRYNPGSNRVM